MASVTMNGIILCILAGSVCVPQAYGRVFNIFGLASDEGNSRGKGYSRGLQLGTRAGERSKLGSFASTITTSTAAAPPKPNGIHSYVQDSDKLSSNDQPWSWSSREEEASTKLHPKLQEQIATKSAVRSTESPRKISFSEQSSAEASDWDWEFRSTSEEKGTTTPSTADTATTTPTWTSTEANEEGYVVYPDYEYYIEPETTTKRSTKKPKTTRKPRSSRPHRNDILMQEKTTPMTTSTTTSTSTPTTTSSIPTTITTTPPTTTTIATATTLPPNKDQIPNKLTPDVAPPASSTPQPTTTPPSSTTPSPLPEKKSIAYQYAERSRNFIDRLKGELNCNKYVVAQATYRKAAEVLKYLQHDVDSFLANSCRSPEYPDFGYHSPLHGAEGQTSDRESCETTSAVADHEIEKFEELILANQAYRKQTVKVQENIIKELENLQKNFQESLQDTLGDYADAESRENLLSMCRNGIADKFPPTNEPAVATSQGAAPSVLNRSPDLEALHAAEGVTETAPLPLTPTDVLPGAASKASSDFDEESATEATNVEEDGEPSMNVVITNEGIVVETVPFTLTPREKESYDYESPDAEIVLNIAQKFHKIEGMNQNNKLSDREKIEAFAELIDQVEEAGVNENPEIFELACLIKNSRHGEHVLPYVKHLFPEPVQQVVWGVRNKIELVKNETRYKIFADPENNVQKITVLGEGTQVSPLQGEIWKFFLMNEGTAFMLFNVQRNAVLMTVTDRNATLSWPQEAEVKMDSVAGRDVTMLQKRPEYLWSLELACEPTDEDTSSTERTRFGEKDLKCFVVIQSHLYMNLALNLNEFGYVTLLPNERPGLFKIKDAKA